MSLYEVVVTTTSAYLVEAKTGMEAEDLIRDGVEEFDDISTSTILRPVERVIHHYDKDKIFLLRKNEDD